jgi:hypothetical protein
MLALVHEGVRNSQIGAALHSNWMKTGAGWSFGPCLVGAKGKATRRANYLSGGLSHNCNKLSIGCSVMLAFAYKISGFAYS